MNKNKNKYSYFLEQCNITPLSEDWRAIFGSITKETIKQFNLKVKNPNDYHEALNFVKILNEYLKKPLKFYDSAYKDFCNQDRIPNAVRIVIDEVLSDNYFQTLVKKERSVLEISIKTGLKLPDPIIYGEHKLTPQEDEAINRLSLYAALTGESWRKFFMYLLIYNYVMPITHLGLEELPELAKNERIGKLLNKLLKKIKAIPLKKRQTNLITKLLKINEKVAVGIIHKHRDFPLLSPEEKCRKISRISKSNLRKLLKVIYPENTRLAKALEAIKKRRQRVNKRAKKQLQRLKERASSLPHLPKITID